MRADAGRALVDGHDCAQRVARGAAVARRAAALERPVCASHGRENIAYYARLHGLPTAELERATRCADRATRPRGVADRRAKGYSQGERLKVALARALIHRPQTIILDEPTNGLDVNAVRMLRELIRELRSVRPLRAVLEPRDAGSRGAVR